MHVTKGTSCMRKQATEQVMHSGVHVSHQSDGLYS